MSKLLQIRQTRFQKLIALGNMCNLIVEKYGSKYEVTKNYETGELTIVCKNLNEVECTILNYIDD